VCLYSCLTYLACKLPLFCVALYCHLRSVWLYRYLPHYLMHGTIFGKKNIEYKMCVLIFYNFCLKHLILRRIQRDSIINIGYLGLHVKYSLFVSDFNENWIFSTDFLKIHKYQISWNPCSWSRLVPFGLTDLRSLIVTFRKFANAHKMLSDIVLLKSYEVWC
jgi:hypothetical protein